MLNFKYRKIWLISPYFILDKYLIKCFYFLFKKNVKINIIISKFIDNLFIHIVTFIFIKIFKKKICFYFFKNGFNHCKIYVIEKKIILFGSINLDNRSIYLNLENIVLVTNKNFIKIFLKLFKKKIFKLLILNFKKKNIFLKLLYIIFFLNYLIL